MKGDFTRSTFRRANHFSGVLMQQGRVQLDSDWNEQGDITAYRAGTTVLDTIGESGAPVHDAGFAIVASAADLPDEDKNRSENQTPPAVKPADLLVGGGRFYVHGELAENDRICLLSDQPDLPAGLPRVRLSNKTDVALPPPKGSYLVYLDVWQRHITALEAPLIREVALGGPDTATRTKTVWQVKLLQVPALTSCNAELGEWDALIAPSGGKLAARAEPGDDDKSPCVVAPGAGYRRLENQLYRVEVHDGGALGTASFKWSRDNGSVVVACSGISGNDLIVASTGRDQTLGFATGLWVELTDDTHELAGVPGTLVQLTNVKTNALTVDPSSATGSLNVAKDFANNAKVRRWDTPAGSAKVAVPSSNGGWIKLEDGVEIKFSGANFRSGDYWLIPARTANPIKSAGGEWPRDAATDVPLAQAPGGITHRYARLAVVEFDGAGFKVMEDCRKLFPPLTELDDPDGWHKMHNRYLHGWGVVCGLRVTCDDDRRFVQVGKGYALDCDGTDLLLKQDSRRNLVEAAKAQQLLDAAGNGKVQLLLKKGQGKTPAFDLRADPGSGGKTALQQILDGTLANDVLQDCVKPILDFVQKDLFVDPAEDKRLVGEGTRNRIASFNLLVQLLNKTEGGHVFLSAEEHDRLLAIYDRIKKFIASKDRTFCAIFDGLAALPAYPFAKLGVTTTYGKAMQPKLRIAPDGKLAYAFGAAGNTIQVVNLGKSEVVDEIAVQAVAGLAATLQDVAVLDDMLIVAAAGAGGSTLYVYSRKDGAEISRLSFVDIQIVRLGAVPLDKNRIYAIVQGEGLYRFVPRDLTAGDFDAPLAAFNASGHLEVGTSLSEGALFATSAAAGAPSSAYTQVEALDVAGKEVQQRTIALRSLNGAQVQGTDGLALLLPARGRGAKTGASKRSMTGLLYVAVDAAPGSQQKRILALDVVKGASLAEIALPTNQGIALMASPSQDFMLVSMEEHFQIARIDPADNAFHNELSLPAQMQPMAMGIALAQKSVLVANRTSQTISQFPIEVISARPGIDAKALDDYRNAMIGAFTALLARMLQMVKDCMCEHLLVQCEQCDESDVLVLASIEVRANKVHSICGLARKEVVTFPKFFYWLSAVPIIPMITWAVEKFCCAQLPQLAQGLVAGLGDTVASNTIVSASNNFNLAQFKSAGQDALSRANLMFKHVSLATLRDAMPPAANTVRLRAADLVGKPADQVAQQLADSGVEVNRVASYDEALAGNALTEIGNVPLDMKPGEKLTLYTRNGQVAFFTRGTVAATAAVAQAPRGLNDLGGQIDALKADLAARKKEVSALKRDLAAMSKQVADFAALKRQVDALVKQQAVAKPKK